MGEIHSKHFRVYGTDVDALFQQNYVCYVRGNAVGLSVNHARPTRVRGEIPDRFQQRRQV